MERESAEASSEQWSSGGRLCLDFVDTVDWRLRDAPVESLSTYADLITWARRAEDRFRLVLAEHNAAKLLNAAARQPERARAMLDEALALREALYHIFRAIARNQTPSGSDLATLNRALGRAMAHVRLAHTASGYEWEWADDEVYLDRVLWPVARSAAELLTGGDLSRVRECDGRGCGWLFYDSSKNRSRRWCSMQGCGNRAKARRHYTRTRQSRPQPTAPTRRACIQVTPELH